MDKCELTRKPLTYGGKIVFSLFALLGIIKVCVASAAAQALIVLSNEQQPYQIVNREIILQSKGPVPQTISVDNLRHRPVSYLQQFNPLITVGSAAADYLFANAPDGSQIISSFIPKPGYRRLLNRYAHRLQQVGHTAVFLDQPYHRHIRLARAVQPDARNLGVILGPTTGKDLPALETASKAMGFRLNHDELVSKDNPLQMLQPIMAGSDIFLALPDQAIFNRTTAKWILFMSYQQHIPLIGFSRSYVDAGALAAVISTPEQIGLQTAEILNRYNDSGTLPPAGYSAYFSVITNPQVARNLNIELPAPSQLEARLKEVEQR
ncbi:ABC transporter substrate-binding protein [Aliamphritea hakodatensis]|uniref:ABC transporter substrate-binding protein n=1 Tax=Aliamphritea hakodatensis TaxID=2895352 RepID=UPI0022FD70F8|nr:ABC transporter substrate binding protein [Aliamphritea hakodatensis]